MPSTFGRRELTGKTVPPNGLLTRFHMIVRPTLPSLSVAPITATVSGRKMASNCSRSYPRTSWAGSALLERFIGRSLRAYACRHGARLRQALCQHARPFGLAFSFHFVPLRVMSGGELAYGCRRIVLASGRFCVALPPQAKVVNEGVQVGAAEGADERLRVAHEGGDVGSSDGVADRGTRHLDGLVS